MRKFKGKKGGINIVGILFFCFTIILILNYFHISIRVVMEDPGTKDNTNYVGGAGKSLWNNYLKEPFTYLWSDIWIPFFWHPFILNMERIRDHKPIDFQIFTPTGNSLPRY